MSGVGFSELIILFLIGLIVLGPERLPKVANQMGTWLGQARRMTRVMKRQLEEELNLDGDKPHSSPYPRSRSEQFPPKAQAPQPASEQASSPAEAIPNEDDTYSPAHGADEPGSGVGDAPAGADRQPAHAAAAPVADDAGKAAAKPVQDKEKTQ